MFLVSTWNYEVKEIINFIRSVSAEKIKIDIIAKNITTARYNTIHKTQNVYLKFEKKSFSNTKLG